MFEYIRKTFLKRSYIILYFARGQYVAFGASSFWPHFARGQYVAFGHLIAYGSISTNRGLNLVPITELILTVKYL